jgi:hypothetical protein
LIPPQSLKLISANSNQIQQLPKMASQACKTVHKSTINPTRTHPNHAIHLLTTLSAHSSNLELPQPTPLQISHQSKHPTREQAARASINNLQSLIPINQTTFHHQFLLCPKLPHPHIPTCESQNPNQNHPPALPLLQNRALTQNLNHTHLSPSFAIIQSTNHHHHPPIPNSKSNQNPCLLTKRPHIFPHHFLQSNYPRPLPHHPPSLQIPPIKPKITSTVSCNPQPFHRITSFTQPP